MRSRTAATVVGTLFIVATVAGVLSEVLLGPLDAPGSLVDIVQHKHRMALGALLVLIMALAVAMIPAVLFPILRKHSEALAFGYVLSRTVEVVTFVPAAVIPLSMLALSAAYGRAGAPSDAAHYETLRTLLLDSSVQSYPVSTVFFCLSVVLLNSLLYRSRLVPRWISAWALVAMAPYLVDGMLVLFDRIAMSSPLHTSLILPLALNEMALAIWLLVKGFAPPAPPAAARMTSAITQRDGQVRDSA
jgi:hypothetical protein